MHFDLLYYFSIRDVKFLTIMEQSVDFNNNGLKIKIRGANLYDER